MQSDYEIKVSRDTISISGVLKNECIAELMSYTREITFVARYPNIHFDLSKVESCYSSALVTLLARIKFLQKNQIDISITPPISARAASFLSRTDWLHHIDPKLYKRSNFRPEKSIPIFIYEDSEQQGIAVTSIIRALLLQIPSLERLQLRSAQWALFEITDNVLNHARSIVGGIVHCQIHPQMKLIEFVVADSGIGISATLKEPDHGLALQKAITEGVTANKETNQGNGLYGTWRLATMSDGIFVIHSHRGRLFVRPTGSVKLEGSAPVYPGTYVIFQIDYSNPSLIESALTFKDSLHVPPYDYIEEVFENNNGENTCIRLMDHVQSMGSREAGKKVSNLINNVIRMSGGRQIEIDFADVLIISSSFADECFGRLISSIGPTEFFSRIKFVNADAAIRAIIDRSVVQRMRIAAGAAAN